MKEVKEGIGMITYEDGMRRISEKIKAGEITEARRLIRNAIADNVESPEAYNLLGISYEMQGNRKKAASFYRIAYYLDQTFLPASENLARVCELFYKGTGPKLISWGLRG